VKRKTVYSLAHFKSGHSCKRSIKGQPNGVRQALINFTVTWFMDSGKALEIIAMLIDRILSDFKPFLEFIQRKRLVIIVSLSI